MLMTTTENLNAPRNDGWRWSPILVAAYQDYVEIRVLALLKNNNDNALSLSLKKCNEIMQYQYYVGKNNALSLVMHYFWNFRYDIFRSFYLRKKVTVGSF